MSEDLIVEPVDSNLANTQTISNSPEDEVIAPVDAPVIVSQQSTEEVSSGEDPQSPVTLLEPVSADLVTPQPVGLSVVDLAAIQPLANQQEALELSRQFIHQNSNLG